MRREVVFTPEAEHQLQELFNWIVNGGSPEAAARYTEDVLRTCESLDMLSNRGTARDDIRPGLRITDHKGRTAIAFTVLPERVEILGIFYGGRDYSSILKLQDG